MGDGSHFCPEVCCYKGGVGEEVVACCTFQYPVCDLDSGLCYSSFEHDVATALAFKEPLKVEQAKEQAAATTDVDGQCGDGSHFCPEVCCYKGGVGEEVVACCTFQYPVCDLDSGLCYSSFEHDVATAPSNTQCATWILDSAIPASSTTWPL